MTIYLLNKVINSTCKNNYLFAIVVFSFFFFSYLKVIKF